MDTSTSQISNRWYVQHGARIAPDKFTFEEWMDIINFARSMYGVKKRYLPFVTPTADIFSKKNEGLWGFERREPSVSNVTPPVTYNCAHGEIAPSDRVIPIAAITN